MFKLDVYARDKNGNRGPRLFSSHYPTKDEAVTAKFAYIWLCKNQRQFSNEWKLKKCIIVGPIFDNKYN